MDFKIKKIKIPIINSESPCQLLMYVTSLLLYSKEWVVEKTDIADSISVKQTGSKDFIDIDFKLSDPPDNTIEVGISSDKVKADEFDYAVQTIKGFIAFLLDQQNEETKKIILDKFSTEVVDLLMTPIDKKSAHLDSELNRLENDPGAYLESAIADIRSMVPDIESMESNYWRKIQPLPQHFDDIKDIEETIHLALGLGLEPLDAAKADFMLMSLWLTNAVAKGNIHWNGDAIQNIPTLKPSARRIVELTKKYLARSPQSLEALIFTKSGSIFFKRL